MSQLHQLQASLQAQLDQVNNMIAKSVQTQKPQTMEDMINAAVQRQMATVVNPLNNMLGVIGSALSLQDQQWLSANLNGFTDFLKTQEGKEVILLSLDAFKKHVTGNDAT